MLVGRTNLTVLAGGEDVAATVCENLRRRGSDVGCLLVAQSEVVVVDFNAPPAPCCDQGSGCKPSHER